MNDLLFGLVTALMATNQPAALSNLVFESTGFAVVVSAEADPFEQAYQALLRLDDRAQEEIDSWIQESRAAPEAGVDPEVRQTLLENKIEQRLKKVRAAYEDFLQQHPRHARARIAYGSFLNDVQEEEAAQEQWERARQLRPDIPAVWNNLANYYGHNGPVEKAFQYYGKAIELDPKQPIYFQNFATTVYLFRRQATNHFKLSLDKVFEKAMALYERAVALDPDNFLLATDVAQTYYGINFPPSGDPDADARVRRQWAAKALEAWNRALKLARDDVERQGILLHLARVHIMVGQADIARKHLETITDPIYRVTKRNLLKKLEEKGE